MKEIKKDLQTLKKTIDEVKNNLSQLDGREIEIFKQLKKEFNLSTIEEAKTRIATLTKQRTTITDNVHSKYNKLKEQYDW